MSAARNVFPLTSFSLSKQEEIAAAVAAPVPPPKWLRLVGADIPSRAWYEWHWQRGIDPDAKERIAPSVRAAVIRRDGFVCHLCGGRVERGDVHIDHVEPRSKGGATTLANLKVAHSRCNLRKGNRT